MASQASALDGAARRAVRARLTDLLAIDAAVAEESRAWAEAVRDHPEAVAAVGRIRAGSAARHEAIAGRLAALTAGPVPGGAEVKVSSEPSSASEALARAAEAEVAASFAREAAYQTTRLAYDYATCDLIAAQLGEIVSELAEVRAALPHTVAREHRATGLTCTCRCVVCSLGACGCVRATIATAQIAWTGTEPSPTPGLVLFGPPRPGSPLADAGVVDGDRILTADGEGVGTNDDLWDAVCRHEVGENVRLVVERETGERFDVTVRRVV